MDKGRRFVSSPARSLHPFLNYPDLPIPLKELEFAAVATYAFEKPRRAVDEVVVCYTVVVYCCIRTSRGSLPTSDKRFADIIETD